MKKASLTALRRNLSDMLNAVNADREPLVVTRRRGKPVVLMSLEDYQDMQRSQRAAEMPTMPAPITTTWRVMWQSC